MRLRRNSQCGWAKALTQVMVASRYCKTQTALARKSGVAQSTIGRILRGEVNPQTSTIEFLAEALRIPFKTLTAAAEGDKAVELSLQEFGCNGDCERAAQELEALRREVTKAIEQLGGLVQRSVDLTAG